MFRAFLDETMYYSSAIFPTGDDGVWRNRFNQNWPVIAELGFDDVFRRTWNFYLAYSEAGFAAGFVDVNQFLIGR